MPFVNYLTRPFHPFMKRWMLFVDGENLTIRAQEIAREKGIDLIPSEYYHPDVFIWAPLLTPMEVFGGRTVFKEQPIRSFYYTSVIGDEKRIQKIKNSLWGIGFHPEVFKKSKKKDKAKGVDIALTKDMLSHAFLNNYDIAVIVAGDGDYVPLIQEVKRIGKIVYVAFFMQSGLSTELQISSDMFVDIDDIFIKNLKSYKGLNNTA
jgi:uncharacterized LabA/DUF88 family protein